MDKTLDLSITAINVNSFNLSTHGGANNKTYIKVEGITSKNSDMILISDCRLGKRDKEIERLFGLSRNGKYKLYHNSKRESRGVAITIKASIYHEIIQQWADEENNYLIVKIKIQDRTLLLGVIYGPNGNNVEFYEGIRRKHRIYQLYWEGILIQYSTIGMGLCR